MAKVALHLLIKCKLYSVYSTRKKKYITISGAENGRGKKTNYLTVVIVYLELLHYYNLLCSFKILKVCLEKDPKFLQVLVGAIRELC